MTQTEYRVQWTGSRVGWPEHFIAMIAGVASDHVRRRRRNGESVRLVFAHGDAQGVDKTIGAFAAHHGIDAQTWLPDWGAHGKGRRPDQKPNDDRRVQADCRYRAQLEWIERDRSRGFIHEESGHTSAKC